MAGVRREKGHDQQDIQSIAHEHRDERNPEVRG